MTKRERLEAAYRLKKPDRVPFVPAIYEHKGYLVGRSPSEICRNPEYLYAALQCELKTYDPDALVIGIDVYNVEAEAAGCEVTYFAGNNVPAITKPLVTGIAGLDR
ncbi:MAG TPA: uroporphyrinogen decarboxylase family protein, partial [Bryobacteraceae bacterium]|nr:uroporphyrinogen decarboxylase family protein [Bryobacteraceae bacterium]